MIKRVVRWVTSRGALAMGDQAVFSGSNFIITFLLARNFSSHDFGLYAGLILLLYLLISGSNALIVQPFQVSGPTMSDNREYMAALILMQALLGLAIGLVSLVVIELPISWVVPFRDFRGSLFLLFVGFLMHDFVRKVFLARNLPGRALVIDLMASTVLISSLLLMVWNGTLSLGPIILWSAIAYGIGALVGLKLINGAGFSFSSIGHYATIHVKQGKWLLGTAFVQWGASNLFVVASGVYLGASSLGAFRLVQSVFGVLNLVFQSYENYVLPRAVHLFATSVDESKAYLRSLGLKGALAFGSLLIIMFVLADSIILWMGGQQYREFGFVIRGMAILYLVILLGYPLRIAIRMMVLNRSFFIGYVISFVFSAIAASALLVHFGLIGAIAGLVINQLLLMLVWSHSLAQRQFYLWK